MTGASRGMKLVAGIGALALGLTACGGSTNSGTNSGGTPQKGGILKLVGAGGSDDLNPTSAYSTSATGLIRTYARQLYSYESSPDPVKATTPVPDAAAALPEISPDGLTYKITLRKGIMWDSSPAREMVAGDFVRTFKNMCNPADPVGATQYYLPVIQGMQSFCDPFLNNKNLQKDPKGVADYENGHEISGVKALDDHTLQIQLVKPASDLLNLLAMTFASAVPVEYLNYVQGTPEQFNHLVSSGPYKVTSFTAGKSITFAKNPVWKQDVDPLRHQYVNAIQITEGTPDASVVLQQIQNGQADISFDVVFPTSKIGVLADKKDPNFAVYGPPINNPYLTFNFRSPNENGAVGKVGVRQAIEYAINKVALAKIYGGARYNTPLHTVIPPQSVGYQDQNLYQTPGDQGDPAKCKSTLAAAGYPNGLTLKAAYRTSGNHPAIFQSYAQDLKACGINVQGIAVPAADFYTQFLQKTNNATSGKWDIAAPGWVPDWFGNNGRSVMVPLFDGRNWADGSSNYGGFNDPQVNSLIDQALTAKADQAPAAWTAVDQKVMQDAAIVPFMAQMTPWYHSARVHNAIWTPNAANFDFTQLWLSK